MYYEFLQLSDEQCTKRAGVKFLSFLLKTHPVHDLAKQVLGFGKNSFTSVSGAGDKLVFLLIISSLKLKFLSCLLPISQIRLFELAVSKLKETDAFLTGFLCETELVLCRPYTLNRSIHVRNIETASDLIKLEITLKSCSTVKHASTEKRHYSFHGWRSNFIVDVIKASKAIDTARFRYLVLLWNNPVWYEFLLGITFLYLFYIKDVSIAETAGLIIRVDIAYRLFRIITRFAHGIVSRIHLRKWKGMLLIAQEKLSGGDKRKQWMTYKRWLRMSTRLTCVSKAEQYPIYHFYFLMGGCFIIRWLSEINKGGGY